MMETIFRNELKDIIRETFVEILSERKDIIENAVFEALEDFGLAKAMAEGDKGDLIDMSKLKKNLASKAK